MSLLLWYMEPLHRCQRLPLQHAVRRVFTTWERMNEQRYSTLRSPNLPQVQVPIIALLEVSFLLIIYIFQLRRRQPTPANPLSTTSQHSAAPIIDYSSRRKAPGSPSLVSQAATALAVVPITFCVTGLAGGLLAITLVDSVAEACGLVNEKPHRVLTMT